MATIKQRLAFKEVVKGSTISGAMRKVGYAATTAARTNKLTSTDGWKELMDTFVSDKALAKVHNQGLGATTYFNEIVGRDAKGAPEYQLKKIPDFGVRHKYLESGYKLKGRYAKDGEAARILIVNITSVAAKKYGIDPTEYGTHPSTGTSNS